MESGNLAAMAAMAASTSFCTVQPEGFPAGSSAQLLTCPLASALPENQITRNDHPRRLFIGPMPQKTLAEMHGVMGEDDASIDAACAALTNVLDHHAHEFYLREGGREECWDDEARENVCGELMRRWRESPWTRPLRRQYSHRHGGITRWVGGSFEVGNILGVSILGPHAPPSGSQPPVVPETPQPPQPQHELQSLDPTATVMSSSTGPRSYWTARTEFPQLSPQTPPGSSSFISLPEHGAQLSAFSSGAPLLTVPSSPSFPTRTPEYTPEHHDTPPQGKNGLKSILKRKTGPSPSKARNNGRNVSVVEQGAKQEAPLRSKTVNPSSGPTRAEGSPLDVEQIHDDRPVPPVAVLARSGSDVMGCSAGAAPEAASSQEAPGDIVLRDRMLVRILYTKCESLPSHFDEVQNRQTLYIRHEDCAEFLVVWRRDRIELYEDYTFPGRERLSGHKYLAFIIPLASGRTSVSMYSFIDQTFCILCPPVQASSSKTRTSCQTGKGTNVFIFKVKSRSRAQDWLWQLWRHLGGKIPPLFEIRCPELEMRIDVDIPTEDARNFDKAFDAFSHKNITGFVHHSLHSGQDNSVVVSRAWKTCLERELQAGEKLELVWRIGGQLDWVCHERDVEGNVRPWAILAGLAFRQGTRTAQLELRLGKHSPDHVHLQNGKKLIEPPAIEGYLDRIRIQGRQRVYLATHDGHLFSLLPSEANPPIPPSAHLSLMVSGTLHPSLDEYAKNLFESEVWRGADQIRAASGEIDLRNIQTVRRAYRPLADDNGEDVAHDGVDAQDVGGHQGHARVHDKAQLHLRRGFEVVLASGHIIRFEAHSAMDCIEWVRRLRALITYWSQRHRVDTQDEMDLAYLEGKRCRLTPKITKCHASGHPTPPEPQLASDVSMLPLLHNWCPLNGCRSIVKSGRAFMRKGLRGQYKLVELFLVSGRLVKFHVSPDTTLHHKSSKEIGLLDAYVCSGYLAALALRRSEFNPESPGLPRRYRDGLETHESEEDELFVIWYRKSVALAGGHGNAPAGAFQPTSPIPSLAKRGKHKLLVFRMRSKVERDAWCWALGCEIEKVVRNNKDRERRVREAGGLVDLSH